MKKIFPKLTLILFSLFSMSLILSCTNNVTCYKVNFNLEGGTSKENLEYICQEGTILNLFIPEKVGFSFGGWEVEGKVINETVIKVEKDMTLKAIWQQATFTITLDFNDNTSENKIIAINKDDPITLPIPQYNGYQFVGWYLDDEIFCDETFIKDENITLIAKWEPLDIEITYLVDENIYGKMVIRFSQSFILPTVEKSGYKFLGWYLNNELFTKTTCDFYTNIELVAKFEKETYLINLIDDDEKTLSVQFGDVINLPNLEKKGYNFLGWFQGDTLFKKEIWDETSDIILIAKWEKIAYQIVLLEDGFDPIIVYYQDQIELPILEKRGYSFLGWYEGNLKFTDLIWEKDENITLTPKWEKCIYTITLIDDDTTYISIGYGDVINLPILSKEGYKFLGWFQGDKVFNDTNWERTTDITVVAKWEKGDSKTLINSFDILLYNTQNSGYDQISLYEKNINISASKYWHKIGIRMVGENYYVSGTATSGESLAEVGSYDYIMLAYSSYERYSEFVQMDLSVGDLVEFGSELTSLEKGNVCIRVSFYHETKVLPPLEIIQSFFNTRYSDITEVDGDLDLVSAYEEYVVTWTTSNQDVMTSSGNYQKPYTTRNVVLKAYIESQEVYQFSFIVHGTKEKSNALATGYFYTNFNQISEKTIAQLDIMYCSFAYVNKNAEFTNVQETTTFIKNIKNYVIPLAKKYGTKVLISVNEKDDAFGTIAMNKELSQKLAGNIVDLINKYDLDGIDIDWEYPTGEETPYFTTMMKDIYTAVKKNNENHLVTAAIGGGKWQPPRYDLSSSHHYLDYINLMTYSMTSANGQFQNALYKSSKGYTLTSCSIDESIVIYDSFGVPRNKILVGLAFYGIRQYGSNGLGTPSTSSASISFRAIYETYLGQNESTVIIGYDDETASPYIYDAINKVLISYENEQSIARKCEYVNTLGLAGVMYWQDGHDYGDTLLNAVVENIRK